MSDINVNELSESINDKADRDLLNASPNVDVVIETYKSGTSWYRLYKSGWIEQGGYVNSLPCDNYASVTFLKAFIDTNYFFTNQVESAYAIGNGWDGGNADEVYTSRTTTGTVVTGDGISDSKTHYGFFWIAKGFIAR